ncbi:MAG: tRNA lysidine(34) synthetase TilS [Marinicaulis sp.]|nr:tRNA lysidine(34) synthetase TilS [Marinicaulis sp.]
MSALTWKWRASIARKATLKRAGDVHPLTDEEFARACDEINLNEQFAVAVSGGRDSMALAQLAAAFVKSRGLKATAYTVDHGLRAQSAAEARQVAEWCNLIGLRHRTLNWVGKKPTSGVQEAARNARYFLLARAAEEDGIGAILTGHSADDVAETYLMRRERSNSAASLAAMRSEISIAAAAGEPIRMLRPLLSVSRDELTATVKARGQGFIDDPSNEDASYERVRIRQRLREKGAKETTSLVADATEARGSAEKHRQFELNLFKHTGGCFYAWGGASINARLFAEARRDFANAMFRRLLRAVSGEDHPPAMDATMRAAADILRGKTATLSGAIAAPKGDKIWVYREPAALLGRAGVAPILAQNLSDAKPIFWDRRFIIAARDRSENMRVLPLGAKNKGIEKLLFYAPRMALQSVPGIFDEATLIAGPAPLSPWVNGINIRALAQERFSGEIIRFSEV